MEEQWFLENLEKFWKQFSNFGPGVSGRVLLQSLNFK